MMPTLLLSMPGTLFALDGSNNDVGPSSHPGLLVQAQQQEQCEMVEKAECKKAEWLKYEKAEAEQLEQEMVEKAKRLCPLLVGGCYVSSLRSISFPTLVWPFSPTNTTRRISEVALPKSSTTPVIYPIAGPLMQVLSAMPSTPGPLLLALITPYNSHLLQT
ncbi:uncharacterized protein EDB91DRAFT_1083814 [Suillus paluster]|uniref:uncharacterized protein n=1 Tax=Suillus paluster TaxID=48578 RepID=UPI001B874397|nr:uncharacterized protein EDB91DRAFT_1083814 [Suillus paluster]KAG1735068.1 hypothetical protein EDB91DRAFT_1083814 [Suillus paluster]